LDLTTIKRGCIDNLESLGYKSDGMECPNQQLFATDIALGGSSKCARRWEQQGGDLHRVAPGGKGMPARRWLKYSGTGRALAPGGRQVPPGDLGLCRLATLGTAPGDFAAGYDLCALILIDNDATLGSGDTVQ